MILVSIPNDPTRRFALALRWPGQALGHWSFTAAAWVAAFDPAACLLPIQTDPDDASTLQAWVDVPSHTEDIALKLWTVDQTGKPILCLGVETLSGPYTAGTAPVPTPTSPVFVQFFGAPAFP